MRKITRQDFQKLQQHYPVLTEEEMRYYVGGYSDGYSSGGIDDWLNHGFGGYDPNGNYHWYSGYTLDELNNWEGDWPGGWVYGLGYVAPDTVIYGYYGDTSRPHYEIFNSTHFNYDFVEGMGAGATYQSSIAVRNSNGILDIACTIKGIPGYSVTYTYSGCVEIYVNGQKREETYLYRDPNGTYLTEQGTGYIGGATVDLSKYHGQVEVKVITSGGRGDSYTGYSANSGSTTIYNEYRY